MSSKQSMANNPVGIDDVDANVLARCRDNDRSAQQRLYEACFDRVSRLIVRIVGSQDAEDLTQQVFLHLFRKIGQFEGHSSFATWLYRLTTNEALQHLRKQRRWKFETLIQEPMSPPRKENEFKEERVLLERALGQLEPELRTIFVLREVEGLSYREIAESMEIPEGTVGSRLNRARRELQQLLTKLGWTP